ncbi:MAG: GntR family transcriptional regulator [Limisphaerales bacterium]
MAAKLGVSRGTVRSGISKLVFEGVLERKAGVGTRISSRNVESGIPRLGAVSPAKWLPRASRLKIFNKVLIA